MENGYWGTFNRVSEGHRARNQRRQREREEAAYRQARREEERAAARQAERDARYREEIRRREARRQQRIAEEAERRQQEEDEFTRRNTCPIVRVLKHSPSLVIWRHIFFAFQVTTDLIKETDL